ncbi:MAG: lipoprotein [Pseudomonadota bacterium]
MERRNEQTVRIGRLAVLLPLLLVLAACGQKGPLYLPDPPPANGEQGEEQGEEDEA